MMAYERAGQPGRTPQWMKAWGGPSPELYPPHSLGAGSRLTLWPWTSTARAREEGPLRRNDRLRPIELKEALSPHSPLPSPILASCRGATFEPGPATCPQVSSTAHLPGKQCVSIANTPPVS